MLRLVAELEPFSDRSGHADRRIHVENSFGARSLSTRPPGTWKTSNDKFDYLLLSPEAFSAVTSAGLNRSGVWHGPRVKNPWTMLDELKNEAQAASGHAAIWADLTL